VSILIAQPYESPLNIKALRETTGGGKSESKVHDEIGGRKGKSRGEYWMR